MVSDKGNLYVALLCSGTTLLMRYLQESPHEHQQTLLLSRIITNIVC